MIVYRQLVYKYSPETDSHGAITQSLTQELIVMNIVIRVVYAVAIIVFGVVYKSLALKQTNAENWRYEKQHSDELINRLFKFNIFNFYLPMIIVAFDPINSRNIVDLFYLMFI